MSGTGNTRPRASRSKETEEILRTVYSINETTNQQERDEILNQPVYAAARKTGSPLVKYQGTYEAIHILHQVTDKI